MLRPQQNQMRHVLDLSGLWHFQLDPDATGEQHRWYEDLPAPRNIAVPGSWNEQFTDTDLYLGHAWYHRTTYVPPAWRGSRVLVHVGSANYAARVWINGQFVGAHLGGHLPFSFDITDQLSWNVPNRIAIEVENELRPDRVPPGNMTGVEGPLGFGGNNPPTSFDFFPYAGIHRPVTLVSIPRTHIDDLTVITEIEGTTGVVHVTARTNTDWSGPAVVTIGTNDELREEELTFTDGVAQGTLHVPDVRLWHPDDPALYPLTISLRDGEDLVDTYSLDIGIRTIAVEGDRLLLNGEPVELRGFGKHEDSPSIGRGINLPQATQDTSLMKWLGANSYRTAHYPYAEETMDLADRMGFLVIDEIPAVGLAFSDGEGNIRARLDQCKQQITELLARDKNHPSVISWSVANEPIPNNMGLLTGYEDEEDPSGEDMTGGNAFFEELTTHARELDSSRPVIIVGVMGGSPRSWLAMSDYSALNRYYGWYVMGDQLDVARNALDQEIDALHDTHRKPVVMTEFGADAIVGRHTVHPALYSEEYQCECLRIYLDSAAERPWFVGLHVWNFADFRTAQGIMRPGGFNMKGVFTRDRQPKMAAHLLREYWSAETRGDAS